MPIPYYTFCVKGMGFWMDIKFDAALSSFQTGNRLSSTKFDNKLKRALNSKQRDVG